MKTRYFIIGIVALAVASCSGNKEKAAEAEAATEVQETETISYAGILPAADGSGIQYNLAMEPNGNYLLTEQYDGADTAICITKGSYQLLSDPTVKPAGQYYQLISISNPGDTLNFAVTSDSTITMLTPTLQEAPSGLNYVLTKKNN